MQVMRHRRRLLPCQQSPRLAVAQPGLLHEFERLREGDEQGHGGGSLQWLTGRQRNGSEVWHSLATHSFAYLVMGNFAWPTWPTKTRLSMSTRPPSSRHLAQKAKSSLVPS